MKTIYIDFDGTLVNVYKRYTGILQSFIGHDYIINQKQYIYLKKKRIYDHEIVELLFDGYKIDLTKYIVYKSHFIETKEWLDLDQLIGNPIFYINKIKMAGFKVSLLTARNNKSNLISQLKNLNIDNLFDKIHVVGFKKNINTKLELLKKIYLQGDIIIGDSPMEIDAAHTLNLEGYFVNSGLYNKSFINNSSGNFSDYQEIFDEILNSTSKTN